MSATLAILCDLDGVIRHWDADVARAAERELDLAPGAILDAAFAPGVVDAAITGRCSDEAWRDGVVHALAEAYGHRRASAAIARWSEPVGGIDVAVLDVLRRHRRNGTLIVLVTNATSRLDADLAALGIAAEFDAIVNSSVEGIAKPDERIYRIAADRAGAPLASCVFIDDTRANVDAAATLGMTAIHFDGIDSLARLAAT